MDLLNGRQYNEEKTDKMEDRLKIHNTALREKVIGNMKRELRDINNRVRRSNISLIVQKETI